MDKNEVLKRLKHLDMSAYTKIKDNKRYSCIIVGGGALMLLGFSNRVTYDIMNLDVMRQVDYDLLDKLAEELKFGMLNDYDIKMFEYGYNDFIEKAREANLCGS